MNIRPKKKDEIKSKYSPVELEFIYNSINETEGFGLAFTVNLFNKNKQKLISLKQPGKILT